jgi:hypothetical protein
MSKSRASWSSEFLQTEFGQVECSWRNRVQNSLDDDNRSTDDEQNEFSCEVSTGEVIGVEAVSRRAPMDHTVI